jgi:hypothetical protein
MTATRARITPVRLFHEDRGGRPRRHVLAIYDTGESRVLIDRGERMAIRLLTVLNDGQEHECVDGPPQIAALCDDYVRQYLRVGGPLACRLTREHLSRTRLARPSVGGQGPPTPTPRSVDSRPQRGTARRGTSSSDATATEHALGFAA